MGCCQCMLTLRRLFFIFVLVSVLLIIAGFVFIVIGALNYENTREEIREGVTRKVGAVIDAGGSGTRIILYSYRAGADQFIQRSFRQCENEGIAKYAPSRLSEVPGILNQCMNSIIRSVDLPKDKTVPLYFAATGGMRLLKERNITQYNELFQVVKTTLDNSLFNASMIATISGEDEATYGWLATNTISKETSQSSGMLDFGSTSLQISFKPAPGTVGPSGLQNITLNGKDVTVYGNSYLCFGRNEMEKRVFAKLIKDSGYQNTTENPCLFDGFVKEYDSMELFQQPCVYGLYAQNTLGEAIDPPVKPRKFKMRGTGNQTECANVLDKLINLNCTGGKLTCGLNDIYQPTVNGKFYAVSAFYYVAEFIGLPRGSTVGDFKQKTDELCAKSWKQIEKNVKDPYTHATGRCFDATYSYFLLKNGFKFSDDSEALDFVLNVEGKNVQWSLGLISTMKEKMLSIPGFSQRFTIILQSPNMIGLIVIGVIFIILGSILLALAIKARRNKDRTLVQTAEYSP